MNILALTKNLGDKELMEIDKGTVSTSEKDKLKTSEINGYTVNISFTEGKTLYQCMERVVKSMNDRLQY